MDKCNCQNPHCKDCENRRIVETGVKSVVEANEHSTDLREKAQQDDPMAHYCGDCDAFCECGLGGENAAKADDIACEYFDDTSLSQMKRL